eukprot:s443_g2.t1
MSHNTDRKKLKVEEMTCKTSSVFAANTFSVALHGVLKEEEWKVRWQCHWHHFAEEAFLDGAGLGLLVKPDPWDWPLTLAGMELWPFGVHRFVGLVVVVEKRARCFPGWMAPDLEMLSGSFSAAFAWCFLRCAGLMVRPHCTLMDTYVVVAFPLTWLAFLSTVLAKVVLPRYVEDQEAEEVQHCIASAAAIVVGLAWDKAFESLTVHMTQGWYGHYVIGKVACERKRRDHYLSVSSIAA